MKSLKCKKCGWEWLPRVLNVKACPRCKSHYWNTSKIEKPPQPEKAAAPPNTSAGGANA